jgi:FtsP/CotA-like multicopper oxidase with cupredoxin domain
MKIKQVSLLVVGMLCISITYSATLNVSLYVNRGLMKAVDTTYLPYLAFNPTASFSRENSRIIAQVGDSIALKVINTDTVDHGFSIKQHGLTPFTILPNDSVSVVFAVTQIGVHIFYDHLAAEAYRYMGLAGMLIVKDPAVNASRFYWNIKDHQKAYNTTLNQGGVVDWSAYYPDYFTINGNSNPHINTDTNARVTGHLGDTIYIYMVNTGQALHSIHFHGYHATIMRSSRYPKHIGRSKDTFSIHSMESVVVELIPHQLGEYPVHDHNLVAVSGGKRYPNGMFLTLLIQ